MRVHNLQNVQNALDFLQIKHRIKLVNIRNDEIVDGNQKLILGLIWTLILHFQVQCVCACVYVVIVVCVCCVYVVIVVCVCVCGNCGGGCALNKCLVQLSCLQNVSLYFEPVIK